MLDGPGLVAEEDPGVALEGGRNYWFSLAAVSGGTIFDRAVFLYKKNGNPCLSGRIYTTTADFHEGTLTNVNTGVPDQVQLDLDQPTGTWRVVYDGCEAGVPWGTIEWNAEVPAFMSLIVEVRAADQLADLPAQSFIAMSSGVNHASISFLPLSAPMSPPASL